MLVEIYNNSQKLVWDEFIQASKNGTFLFYRDYMEYHRNRFKDLSLLIRNRAGNLVAILPANQKEDIVVSHGGLTYGGFVSDKQMNAILMLEVFEHTLMFLKQQGIGKFIYKVIPHIYHRLPAQEDAYALFRHGATLYRRDLTTVVMPKVELKFQKRRERSLKKAIIAGVICKWSDDYEQFWPVLEQNLWTSHRLKPVHTLDEIRYLQSTFPNHIKLYCAFLEGQIIAGTVIYETATVAHAQYIASTEEGRACGALDLLFFCLITQEFKDKSYFNFGVSTEQEGKFLNQGLVEFKEGFGGRAVTHDFFTIDLCQWQPST